MGPKTEDAFFQGKIQIRQRPNGYRFSIDAVLLASAVCPKAAQTLVDLGTGCGIIPLILGFRYTDIRIHAVEIQTELAELASFNVRRNGMQDRVDVIRDDLRTLNAERFGGPVDWVVSNPPYRRPNSGRINPDNQRALARHEINVNMTELIDAARRLLHAGGQFMTIYPAERLVELLTRMQSGGIAPKWLRTVHSQSGGQAKLALVKGVKGGRNGLVVEAPLVIYSEDGTYGPEVEQMMLP
jgi:tRNA1Val (adenine37-N6)-methyltransferase